MQFSAEAEKKRIEASNEESVILPFTFDREITIRRLEKVPEKPVYDFCKRLTDILFSSAGILVGVIPMLIVAIAIRLDSKGPAFFRQARLGKNGKPFMMIKFRSMYIDAEDNGAQWAGGEEDPRITRVGKLIRKCRMDELPQLFQIFTGKMSLIGPRPERPVFYREFEKYVHGFSQRLMITPGLTGLAQVNGGYLLRPEEKVEFDLEYIEKRSVWLDAKIILKTIAIFFTHEGAM